MPQAPTATDAGTSGRSIDNASRPRSRYREVADNLREEIRRGKHPVGRFLPSEAELGLRFGASRWTVREALRLLDDAGLITRRRGAGSVVRSAEAHVHFGQALHSIDDLMQYTEESDFRLLHTDRLNADQRIAGWLQTRVGTECILLHGVRHGRRSHQIIACTDIYRRASWRGLPSGYASQEEAVRALLEEQFLARIGRIEQTLSALAMPVEAAHELGVAAGSPALRAVRRYFDNSGRLMLVVVALHAGECFSYSMHYKRSDIRQPEPRIASADP
ncbi:MAG: GntR family transcriptional regulator [Rhodanobacteraceae bacterium]